MDNKYKRIIKGSIVVAGLLVVIIIGSHFWFVQNARSVLKNYISEKSGGKIKLQLSGLDLNLFTKRLQIHQADLYSTDSLSNPITYHVTFSKLSIKVYSIWELLFQKKLLIDSIKLYDPVIKVMQWQKDTSSQEIKDELSIPQEMGKVYNSLIDALNDFGVRRIIIDNAAISLVNKMIAASEPVTVSNIFFDLSRIPVKKGRKIYYLEDKQTIELRSTDQNILLPGGRHRLSFKSFNLQLYRQKIELDSCTITATATDSSKSNYTIFFQKLLLTGVDFNAMSTNDVIKADTVRCENPFFNINLYPQDAIKKTTELPDPDQIIRELTGNLDLLYVGVKNAGIQFKVFGKSTLSFSNTHKDFFEIKEFRINPDSAQAVSMKSFNMTLRDYRLYNEDSSTTFSFDSLRFINDNIMLNNFAMLSRSGKKIIRNTINVRVPFFELSDLDWYQLFFEQKIAASEANLIHPVIVFDRKLPGNPGKKTNLFAALLDLDSLVGLQNLTVTKGQVSMNLGQKTSFIVQNIDFNILSNQLLHSTNKEGLRKSIQYLRFDKGLLHLRDFKASMLDVKLSGNNLLFSDKVIIESKVNKTSASIHKVFIDNFQIDDKSENWEADGFRWEKAILNINTGSGGKSNRSSFLIKNIEGNNTHLKVFNHTTKISTYIYTFKALSLSREGIQPILTEGFYLEGAHLSLYNTFLDMAADAYILNGTGPSSLKGVSVKKMKNEDSFYIRTPTIHFSADPNDILAGKLFFPTVNATTPTISIVKRNNFKPVQDSLPANAPIRIDRFTASRPDITIALYKNDSVTRVSIPSSESSMIKSSGIVLHQNGLQIKSLDVSTNAGTYTKPSGEITGVENGKIDMSLSAIVLGSDNGTAYWSGTVDSMTLENATGMGMNSTKGLYFQKASMGNLKLTSDYLADVGLIFKKNVSAWLHIPQGQFIDSNSTLQWYNAIYNNSNKSLSLDSFMYHPTKPVDSVLAHASYQLDYISLKTGKLTVTGFDVDRFKKDSFIAWDAITIHQPMLNISRDKQPPNSPYKKYKPLPVNIIKNFPLPVYIQQIIINDGTISYAEKDGKSRQEGILIMSNLNATIDNIKNRDLTDIDSLSLLLHTKLMDSIDVTLQIKQSYTDSLHAFIVKSKILSADLNVLNSFIVPITNVKITSGVLDSASFEAIANEDHAIGEMDLHYKNLRIKMIKDGDPEKSTFKQNILSFLINTLIVKNHNTNRTGMIYYKHTGDQSFINYIVQITLSGLSTNTGIKSNRKLLKNYNRDLKNKLTLADKN